jgi:RNA polymerase sigma-70 factor (ECF subfamily)
MLAAIYRDEDLITDFQKGHNQAFREIYTRYYERVYFTCWQITRDKEQAEDITLETFNKLFQRYPDFPSIGQMVSFLTVTARNASLNYLRTLHNLSKVHTQFWRLNEENDVLNDEIDAELIHLVMTALESLPDRCREVLRMHYLEEMTYQEIAEVFNISINTVKNHCAKALRMLRSSIRPKHNALLSPSVIILALLAMETQYSLPKISSL